jgi:riboflavin synthase
MFTGIIETVGRVVSVSRRADVLVARLDAGALADGLPEGASVAVNGCCLTACDVQASIFTCELTAETLSRTAFGHHLLPDQAVNLERPLRADGRFDGHIVQGHVDGIARVVALQRGAHAAELVVTPPEGLARYLVEKGSVALDGVSLTVAQLRATDFTIALIPYTLEHTTLGRVTPGQALNLEVDVIAKYVERLLGQAAAGAQA